MLSRYGSASAVLFSILLFGSMIVIEDASAHPPADMALSYDHNDQVLTVEITHNTPTPNSHYVDTVEIYRNDILYDTYTYDSQPEVTTFTYEYDVTALDSDVLRVFAECNIGGDLEEEITVEGPRDRMVLEVNPEIDYAEMGEEKDFTVNIRTEDETPLDGVDLQTDAWLGFVTEPEPLGIGAYSFTYTAPDLDQEDVEVVNITASKNGYHTEYHEFQFDIVEETDPSRKIEISITPSVSSIKEDEDLEFTVKVRAGGAALDVSDITVRTIGGTATKERVGAGEYKLEFIPKDIKADTTGSVQVTAVMPGYQEGTSTMQFDIINVDEDTGSAETSNDTGTGQIILIAGIVIVLMILGVIGFFLYRKWMDKKEEAMEVEALEVAEIK